MINNFIDYLKLDLRDLSTYQLVTFDGYVFKIAVQSIYVFFTFQYTKAYNNILLLVLYFIMSTLKACRIFCRILNFLNVIFKSKFLENGFTYQHEIYRPFCAWYK